MRSQVRLPKSDWIGLAARWDSSLDKSYSGFLSSSTAFIGIGGGGATILAQTAVDFDVSEEDVLIQLDVFEDTITFWAWPADEQMPDEPTLTAEGQSVASGRIFLWAGQSTVGPALPVEGAFRFVHLATASIPEPSSTFLVVLGWIGVVAISRRRKDGNS